MIGPRMATMLGFLLTDARSGPTTSRTILAEAVDRSFNCISVEGHASTNDTVLLLSSTAGAEPILRGEDLAAFAGMVRDRPAMQLARMIADDGEGATHFITIDVEGCRRLRRRPRDRSGRRRQPARQDRHPRRRPELGPDRLGRRLRGRAFEEEDLSLWLNDVAVYRGRRSRPLRRRRLSQSHQEPSAMCISGCVLNVGTAAGPVLDLRPDGRVHPAQCGLHDLKLRSMDSRGLRLLEDLRNRMPLALAGRHFFQSDHALPKHFG